MLSGDVGLGRKKIRLIKGNAKCRHLKKLTCKGTLRRVFIRVYRLAIVISNLLRTFSHVGIFNPECDLLPLSTSLWFRFRPLPPPLCEQVHVRIQYETGEEGL
jgi:hypothetical protein